MDLNKRAHEQLLTSSLLTFTKKMFLANYKREFIVGKHHIMICDALEKVIRGETTRLIINIAPRYGKTELVSRMFIAYCFAINPKCKFLHLSYSGKLTQSNSLAVKDTLKSDYYRYVFERTAVQYGNDTRMYWKTTAGGEMYATSTLGQITGFGAGLVEGSLEQGDEFSRIYNPYNFGGAIVIDDPIKPDEAYSDAVRTNVNLRFETTIRNRVNSPNVPIIIIMQRLHESDLCGYLEATEPGVWDVLTIPTIQTDESGERKALWEFKHTLHELDHLREINPTIFETQYMQNPTPLEGLMYRSFKVYDTIPHQKDSRVCCYIDTADLGSDYCCCIVYIEHSDANYVIDVLYTKKPMEYTEPTTAEMLSKHKVDNCVIESNNGGRGFKRNVEKLCREMGNSHTYFQELTQTKNKNVRIYTQSNDVCNLTIFPRDWEKLWPEFSRDIVYYRKEGRNAHDDAPDALTGTIEMRRKKSLISDEELLATLL